MSAPPVRRLDPPALLTLVRSVLFVLVLAVSAWFEPDIRWLHFFQSGMYVVTSVLALRRNRWGYFIGLSAAGFWDYCNLFVTSFFFNGLHYLGIALTSGHIQRADQMIAVPGWIGNLLVIVGCGWGYAKLRGRNGKDVLRFALVFVLTTAYFAAAIAICQPRYLPLFRGAIHPLWAVPSPSR